MRATKTPLWAYGTGSPLLEASWDQEEEAGSFDVPEPHKTEAQQEVLQGIVSFRAWQRSSDKDTSKWLSMWTFKYCTTEPLSVCFRYVTCNAT